MVGGSLGPGIPSLAVMAIPLVVGIVIGYFVRKAIKIRIILIVVAIIASYLGFVSFASIEQGTKNLVSIYGPIAASYVAILLGSYP